MREVFAHNAVVALEGDGDVQAPGAAITVALCGHWEHEPPCPLAPHHTAADRDGDMVRLRVLFVAEPEDEAEVRRRIRDAVAGAQLTAPDGTATRWRVVSTTPRRRPARGVRAREKPVGGLIRARAAASR